jgi:hypothetical protein
MFCWQKPDLLLWMPLAGPLHRVAAVTGGALAAAPRAVPHVPARLSRCAATAYHLCIVKTAAHRLPSVCFQNMIISGFTASLLNILAYCITGARERRRA